MDSLLASVGLKIQCDTTQLKEFLPCHPLPVSRIQPWHFFLRDFYRKIGEDLSIFENIQGANKSNSEGFRWSIHF
jgi:hypothetical protein